MKKIIFVLGFFIALSSLANEVVELNSGSCWVRAGDRVFEWADFSSTTSGVEEWQGLYGRLMNEEGSSQLSAVKITPFCFSSGIALVFSYKLEGVPKCWRWEVSGITHGPFEARAGQGRYCTGVISGELIFNANGSGEKGLEKLKGLWLDFYKSPWPFESISSLGGRYFLGELKSEYKDRTLKVFSDLLGLYEKGLTEVRPSANDVIFPIGDWGPGLDL